MIAFLSGRIIGKIEDKIILRLPSGVGYIINVAPFRSYMINENLEIFVYETFNKDAKSELYGFDTLEDRKWLEKLTKVSGVGPKSAANIIYSIGSIRIAEAIETGNYQILCETKGLGAKNAKKIILELKNSVKNIENFDTYTENSELAINFTETLINLGYKRSEIVRAISQMKKDGVWNKDESIVTLVKAGLKYLK